MNNNAFDWDAIRVFLAVAEGQSLSAAAEQLSLSQPTVGRHVARLEEQLGLKLFDRHQSGYRLTPGGQRLVETARTMARGAAEFRQAVDLEKTDAPCQVCRIALGEWGQFYLSQHAHALIDGLSGVRLEFFADDAFWDLSRDAADIAIGNRPPRHAHLIAQKLGKTSFSVYTSREYLDRYPDADHRDTWTNQHWAGYCGARSQLRSSKLLRQILGETPATYAVNTSVSLLRILKAGHAMGILPDWIGQQEGLVRLSLSPLALGESWMSFHERLRLHPKLAEIKNRIAALYRTRISATESGLVIADLEPQKQ